MDFFRQFFEKGAFLRSLNAIFLVLIPKKGGAKDLKNFRFISLVRWLYKLLDKVLGDRLKRIVGIVVSNFQHASVEGRQSLDATVIANEAIDSRFKHSIPASICKLDIETAYHHAN